MSWPSLLHSGIRRVQAPQEARVLRVWIVCPATPSHTSLSHRQATQICPGGEPPLACSHQDTNGKEEHHGAGSESTPKAAECCSGHTRTAVAGTPRTSGTSVRMMNLQQQMLRRLPKLDPKQWVDRTRVLRNQKGQKRSGRGPSGPVGERTSLLRDHQAAPPSPPGGLLPCGHAHLRGDSVFRARGRA
jgi:hypothetical protein